MEQIPPQQQNLAVPPVQQIPAPMPSTPQNVSPIQPVAPTEPGKASQKPLTSQPKKMSPFIPLILSLVGIGLIVFLGIFVYQNFIGDMMTAPPVVEEEEEPVDQPVDTSNWLTYESKEYGFKFKYPDLDDNCCIVGHNGSSDARNLFNLSDPETVDFPGTDQTFDGFSVYVDSNLAGSDFDSYVNREIELQKAQYKLVTGNEYQDGGLNEVVLAGNNGQFKGSKISKFASDTNERHYFVFPDNKTILNLTLAPEVNVEEFNKIFTEVLKSLEFTRAEVKACNISQFSITSKIPETWTCNTVVTGESDFNRQITTTIKSDLYTIVITNPKSTAEPCISSGKNTQIGCFFGDFYIRSAFSLKSYQLNGENLQIYGKLKNYQSNRNIYMTIEYKDMKTKVLTDEEKAPLFMFLDSVGL